MKVSKKYLEKVANAAGGMVMAEKKAAGVTRKEQLALGSGIALGIYYVTAGLADESMSPRESAARLLSSAIEMHPAHRDEMLSKEIGDAEAVDVVLSVSKR